MPASVVEDRREVCRRHLGGGDRLLAKIDETVRNLDDADRLHGNLASLGVLAQRYFEAEANSCDEAADRCQQELHRSTLDHLDHLARLPGSAVSLNRQQLFVRLRFIEMALTAYVSRQGFRRAFGVTTEEP